MKTATLICTAVIATSGIVAVPAEAAVNCPAKRVCLSQLVNREGTTARLPERNLLASGNISRFVDVPGPLRGKVSSVSNTTGRFICGGRQNDETAKGADRLIWKLRPHSSIDRMPRGQNNRTQFIVVCEEDSGELVPLPKDDFF